MLETLRNDKNIFLCSSPYKIISIFDHINYDRMDIDLLSTPQRKYIEKKLKKFGYKFKTGRLLVSSQENIKFQIPKQSIISSNPFDIIRREKREDDVFLILTPTQAACFMILKQECSNTLVKELKDLIKKQPVNLKKILDKSRFEKSAELFSSIFKELESFQKEVVESSSLKYKVHLGKIF